VLLRVKGVNISVAGIIATNAQTGKELNGAVGITGSVTNAKTHNLLTNPVIPHINENFSGEQKIRGMFVVYITQDMNSASKHRKLGTKCAESAGASNCSPLFHYPQ